MQVSQQQSVTALTGSQRFAVNKGSIAAIRARRNCSLKTVVPVHPAALGGFTIEGPFYRRPSRVARALDRFFYWLGA
ncbi:hypothetical protein [Paraburkholderia bannensis]|uniref:hypothetical protein n=1 Tax=Paraburkholderia bannensis TaxID=765414 RepID=UPI0005AB88C2|nr:hypothetical protein [Paraburkholderia bannensis]